MKSLSILHFLRLSAVALVLLCASAPISAAPIPSLTTLTNAQRLARGLPIAKPRGFVVRSVDGATRTIPISDPVLKARSQASASPSPKPSSSVARRNLPLQIPKETGYIKVVQVDGESSEFYISKNVTTAGLYGATDLKDNALIVTVGGSRLFSLAAANSAVKASHPWLSFLIGLNAEDTGTLVSGSSSAAYLGGAESEVPAYSSPQPVGVTSPINQGSETTLWSRWAHDLVPRWINDDGRRARKTVLFYSELHDFFGITGDLQAYNEKKAASAQGVEVIFSFEPL